MTGRNLPQEDLGEEYAPQRKASMETAGSEAAVQDEQSTAVPPGLTWGRGAEELERGSGARS